MTARTLSGSVALVTGAGRGIGRAIAETYASEGAKVAVVSRTLSTVDEVVATIEASGGEAMGIQCDVAEQTDIGAAVSSVVEKWGTLHILVNTAQGFGTRENPLPAITYVECENVGEAEWHYMWLTGPTATLRFMRAAFPHMKAAGRGKVINFGATSGIRGYAGNTAYNAAKEAIRAISRTAAREWGKHGINVNVINPTVETRTFQVVKQERPDFVEALEKSIPMGRLGVPLDVANLAVFLASPGSNYVTGSTIQCDGGLAI